jgi:sugar phosphate permease
MSIDVNDPSFKARRVQNWVFLGLMYAMFYMGRYNFSAVNAMLASTFGWTNADLGNITSAGKITYAFAVFLNGPFADRIGGKRAILIGAAGAALFNLLFGAGILLVDQPAVWSGKQLVSPATLHAGMSTSTALALFASMWALNHYFQSFGALSIVKINASWFKVSERGSFAGIFGVMIQSGRTMAFSVGPLIAAALPLQYVFWVPTALIALLFVANLKLVENSPAEAGLGEFDTGDGSAPTGDKVSIGEVLRRVFSSPTAWTIALGSMMIGFVRNGVDDWWAKYFQDNFAIADAKAQSKSLAMNLTVLGALVASTALIVLVLRVKRGFDARKDWSPLKRFAATFSIVLGAFVAVGVAMAMLTGGADGTARNLLCFQFASVGMPIAAVFGGLVSGNMSDALFGSRRAPVIFIAFAGMVAMGLMFLVGGGPLFAAWLLVLISFFIQSAHSLVGGAASMDLGGRQAVATAAGLFDGAQYLAGAIVAQTIGHAVDKYGWGVWAYTYVPFAAVGALLMLRLWNAKPGAGGHGAPAPASEEKPKLVAT